MWEKKVYKPLSPWVLVCSLHRPLTGFGNLDSLCLGCLLKIWRTSTNCGFPIPNTLGLGEMADLGGKYGSEGFMKNMWGHQTLVWTGVWDVASCSSRAGIPEWGGCGEHQRCVCPFSLGLEGFLPGYPDASGSWESTAIAQATWCQWCWSPAQPHEDCLIPLTFTPLSHPNPQLGWFPI